MGQLELTNEMKTWYFTFGWGHKHPETGEDMKDYWLEISATTEAEARLIMISIFDLKWGTSYSEETWPRAKPFFPKGCYERRY